VGAIELSADKQFRITAMLADTAKIAGGKLDVFGGGWTVTGPGPTAFAIVGTIEVPWNEANRRHELRIELIDIDGQAIAPIGSEEPLAFEIEFEIGRPPGLRPGIGIPLPCVVPSPGFVQFPPGGSFEFRISINGESREDWRLPFTTRSVMELPNAA
jgi:hypothetical protein